MVGHIIIFPLNEVRTAEAQFCRKHLKVIDLFAVLYLYIAHRYNTLLVLLGISVEVLFAEYVVNNR